MGSINRSEDGCRDTVGLSRKFAQIKMGVTAMRTVYAVHLGVALKSGHEFECGGRGYIDPSDIVGGE
jgi:hypothetical protein